MPVQFKKLLSRKMTRREFLVVVGSFFMVISGVTGMFERVQHQYKIDPPKKKNSFGTGAYGE